MLFQKLEQIRRHAFLVAKLHICVSGRKIAHPCREEGAPHPLIKSRWQTISRAR